MTPAPWRVLIVDDEPPARRSLHVLLQKYPRFQVAGESGNAVDALGAIRTLRPDLLFLDVEMPGGTGLDALRDAGPEVVPVVVFTTAFAEYALRAFEAQALDYLLKPFSDERFDAVMRRVTRGLEQSRPAAIGADRTLTVREAGRTFVFPVAEIDWIEAEDYCARIHAGSRNVLIRRSLQSLHAALERDGFVRIHRSSIVNAARIREIRPLGSGDAEAVLADGTALRVSRVSRADLDAAIRCG